MSWMDRLTPAAVAEGSLAALEGSEDVELAEELDSRLEGPAAATQDTQKKEVRKAEQVSITIIKKKLTHFPRLLEKPRESRHHCWGGNSKTVLR